MTSASRKSRAGSPRSRSGSGSPWSSASAARCTPSNVGPPESRLHPRRDRSGPDERAARARPALGANRPQSPPRGLLRGLVVRGHPADRDHRGARWRVAQRVHAAARPAVPVRRAVLSASDDRRGRRGRPDRLLLRRIRSWRWLPLAGFGLFAGACVALLAAWEARNQAAGRRRLADTAAALSRSEESSRLQARQQREVARFGQLALEGMAIDQLGRRQPGSWPGSSTCTTGWSSS